VLVTNHFGCIQPRSPFPGCQVLRRTVIMSQSPVVALLPVDYDALEICTTDQLSIGRLLCAIFRRRSALSWRGRYPARSLTSACAIQLLRRAPGDCGGRSSLHPVVGGGPSHPAAGNHHDQAQASLPIVLAISRRKREAALEHRPALALSCRSDEQSAAGRGDR